mgnify:CR=1 FL=1
MRREIGRQETQIDVVDLFVETDIVCTVRNVCHDAQRSVSLEANDFAWCGETNEGPHISSMEVRGDFHSNKIACASARNGVGPVIAEMTQLAANLSQRSARVLQNVTVFAGFLSKHVSK